MIIITVKLNKSNNNDNDNAHYNKKNGSKARSDLDRKKIRSCDTMKNIMMKKKKINCIIHESAKVEIR